MTKLFSPYTIKDVTFKNRLMRSATTSYWSDEEGILRDVILSYYKELAKGGLGVIIKGHSYVSERGKAHEGQSGLSNQRHLPQMTKLTSLVHSYQMPIIAQLNHAGYSAKADRITATNYKTPNWEAREATIDDIQQIKENFTNSAELAIHAGFDGVQIHSAHGYLLSQFLSERINKRNDNYGGSLENRARFLLEISNSIQKKIGSKPIIAVKLNCDDFAREGGLQIHDSIKVIEMLIKKGIDLIEISGGGPEQDRDVRKIRGKPEKTKSYFEANFSGHLEKIRAAHTQIPLAIVDGIRNRESMDGILKINLADFISMSKPFIIEPNFASKLKEGQTKSECIDCRLCLSPERFGKRMLTCAQKNP